MASGEKVEHRICAECLRYIRSRPQSDPSEDDGAKKLVGHSGKSSGKYNFTTTARHAH